MKAVRSFLSKGSESADLIKFLWKAKMWFLIPFVIILLIFAFILIFAQATGIAPFIYTLI